MILNRPGATPPTTPTLPTAKPATPTAAATLPNASLAPTQAFVPSPQTAVQPSTGSAAFTQAQFYNTLGGAADSTPQQRLASLRELFSQTNKAFSETPELWMDQAFVLLAVASGGVHRSKNTGSDGVASASRRLFLEMHGFVRTHNAELADQMTLAFTGHATLKEESALPYRGKIAAKLFEEISFDRPWSELLDSKVGEITLLRSIAGSSSETKEFRLWAMNGLFDAIAASPHGSGQDGFLYDLAVALSSRQNDLREASEEFLTRFHMVSVGAHPSYFQMQLKPEFYRGIRKQYPQGVPPSFNPEEVLGAAKLYERHLAQGGSALAYLDPSWPNGIR